MSVDVGDVATFSAWLPHSRVGTVLARAVDDPHFLSVRSFRDDRERWYHVDSLQVHVPRKREIDPERPWEAYQ